MTRVGLFGGMFNPPHIGHLICAQEALIKLDLERLICMPVGVPVHKEPQDDPGPEVRLELCRAAFEGLPRVEVSDMEVRSHAPSYTVDTLKKLVSGQPEDTEVVLILGSDAAMSLPQWREPETVVGLATLGIVERSGATRREVQATLSELPRSTKMAYFEIPRVDLSSSLLRSRVAEGLPIKYLVPEAVEQHIYRYGLYR